MLTYTFKNGSVVNGTLDQIMKMAAILGETVVGITDVPKGYYHSGTKGIMKIADMNEVHIKNALNKIAYSYYQNLGKEKIEIYEYLKKFTELVQEPKLNELFEELQSRIAEPA